MIISRTAAFAVGLSALVWGGAHPALAQTCTRQGVDVSCDNGQRGVFSGNAIIWADGTRSSLASPHPSVVIGNKSSVVVGPGVFVGQGNDKGKGMVPLDNPSAPNKARCAILDGVSYCN
jgi:hypothetical protein